LTEVRRSSHSPFALWTSRGSGPLCGVSTSSPGLSRGFVRHMKIEWFVALMTKTMLHKTRSAAFNLHPTTCLLLNVFDILATMSDNCRSKIEAWNGLEINGNLFFRPFALVGRSVRFSKQGDTSKPTLPYSSRSTGSGGSLLLNRRSSTRFGRSCFISSSIFDAAFSNPSLVVLVICR